MTFSVWSNVIKGKIPELQKLSTADKFAFGGRVLGRVIFQSGEIAVKKGQLNELDRRFEEYRRNPGDVVTWEEQKAKIRSGRR
jgi:putative addiction module component (TIGR02574 family)